MNLPSIDHLHHATIITGSREENLAAVKGYLVSQGVAIQANPDVAVFDDEQILMEAAERIVRSVSSKKVSEHRFCVISCDRMAPDVQNNLLKTLEEPEPGTHFFILVPDVRRMLPTVLSRCQVVEGNGHAGTSRLEAGVFLKESLAGRFALVEEWTKNKKDEDNLSKGEVLSFLDHLEQELWASGCRDEGVFADIRKMRDYAGIRGGSHRIILDFMAMVAPVVK